MAADTGARRLLTALLLTAAAVLLGVPAPASAGAPDLFDRAGAQQGSYLSLDAHNGTDELQAQRDFETAWGRRSDLVRVFDGWDVPALFTPAQQTLAREGRTLVVSWNSWDRGTGVPWSQVAAGVYDRLVDQRAEEVKQLGTPLLFTFQHEPEHWAGTAAGSAGDFCRAYRHVVQRFRALGVTNASYGEVLMAWSAARGQAEQYWCGDDVVQWLGADGYDWYGCVSPDGPWRTPSEVFDPWYRWGTSHGTPLVITEWGTGEDAAVPGRKAAWIGQLDDMVRARPAIKGVMIYSTAKNRNCPRYSDTSPSSQQAFVAMGADPYYASVPPAPRAPGAATDLTVAQDGPTAATVSWTAPADDGGSPVTGWVLTWQQEGAAAATPTALPADASRQSFPALLPGATYTATLQAVNAVGTGQAATRTVVLGAPAATRPSAPRAVTAVSGAPGGPVTATASWQPPTSTGGTQLTAYRVTALRMSGTGTVLGRTSVQVPADDTTLSMALPRTGTYRFWVLAVGPAGDGPGSPRSNAVTGR